MPLLGRAVASVQSNGEPDGLGRPRHLSWTVPREARVEVCAGVTPAFT